MKIASLLTGILLLVSSILGGGWLLSTFSIFSISSIDCSLQNQKCSAQLQKEVEDNLLGKSFFITDFSREINLSTIKISSFSKQVPGRISLQVEAQQVLNTSSTITTKLNQDEIINLVGEKLDNQNVSAESIQVDTEKNQVVMQISNLQVITTISNLEVDLQKIALILQNLDLDTIDLSIVELDVRYKLPVLRTTKTQFQT